MYQEYRTMDPEDPFDKLISGATKMNERDLDGNTGLAIYSKLGDVDKVKALLQAGAHVNAKNWKKATPLHHAVKNQHKDCAEALVKGGADVNRQDNRKRTPLMLSCGLSDEEITKLLLQNGADLSKRDMFRRTVLHFAIKGGSLNIVKMLTDKSTAELKFQDDFGKTLVFQAVKSNKPDILVFLLQQSDYGLEIPDKLMRYPIHYCVSRLDRSKCLEILLENKANMDVETKDGKSPLISAAFDGNLEAVKVFVTKGADPNKVDQYGSNALIHTLLGRIVHAKQLKYKRTTIHKPYLETALELADAGTNLDTMTKWTVYWASQNDHVQNALEIATKGGNMDVAKLMCLAGSSLGNMKEYVTLAKEALPRYVSSNMDIFKWVKDYFSSPASLKNLTRIAIRKTILGAKFSINVEALNLPNELKKFIMFADLEKEYGVNDNYRNVVEKDGESEAEYEPSVYDSDYGIDKNVVDTDPE